jgi:hypothetical protein
MSNKYINPIRAIDAISDRVIETKAIPKHVDPIDHIKKNYTVKKVTTSFKGSTWTSYTIVDKKTRSPMEIPLTGYASVRSPDHIYKGNQGVVLAGDGIDAATLTNYANASFTITCSDGDAVDNPNKSFSILTRMKYLIGLQKKRSSHQKYCIPNKINSRKNSRKKKDHQWTQTNSKNL